MVQLMKLNGWQRLWIVISVLLLFPTIYLSYITRPTKELILNDWSGHIIEFAVNHDPALSSYKPWEIAYTYRDIPPDQLVEKILRDYVTKHPEFKLEVDSINNIYRNKLEELTISSCMHIIEMLGIWIGLSLFLYLIGITFSWVRQGFKNKSGAT